MMSKGFFHNYRWHLSSCLHTFFIFSAIIMLKCYFSLFKTKCAAGFNNNKFCPCRVGWLLRGMSLISAGFFFQILWLRCFFPFLWEEPALKRICTFFLYSVPYKCKLKRKHPIRLFHMANVWPPLCILPSCSCMPVKSPFFKLYNGHHNCSLNI